MPALSLSGQTKQRQIVILSVGGVLLAALLMFQLPRTLKMLKGQSPPAPAAEETPVTPTPTPTPAPTPVTPVAPTATAPLGAASLSRFKSKDPFLQQVSATAAASSAPSAVPEPTPTESSPAAESSEAPTFAPLGEESVPKYPTSVTIAVNGEEESVKVSSAFPEDNPVFRLVSVATIQSVKVGIAGGTLKGGAATVTLSKGEPLTLLNTIDGKRYKLELISLP